jgi:hypothetical protein
MSLYVPVVSGTHSILSIIGLALPTKARKDIVFRFIIEYYSSLMDFGP